MLYGLATFPGVQRIVSASLTFTHGISPSVCRLSIVPQADLFAMDGPLAFTFGGESIVLPDCRVDVGEITRNRSGEVWQLSILDRRWKWRFGRINGLYNLRDPDGSIRGHDEPPEKSTEKTPQELAELCLKAMGESGYDLSELPNDQRPEVRWNDVPAEALARLCDDLGCRVVLRLDNTVGLCRVGQGADLPSDGILSGGASANPADGPGEIAIECGASRYQMDLPLEAVGVDNEKDEDDKLVGTIVPIDELGYKPDDGWSSNTFSVGDNVLDDGDWELARKSVFRMYRIKFPIDVGWFGRVEDIDHLVIEDEQVETKTESSVKSNRKAAVLGVWFDGTESLTNTAENTEYPRSWSLDVGTGIVTFADPVFKSSNSGGAGTYLEAGLVLRTAIQCREPDTRELKRYIRTRQRDTPAETLPRYYKHHELHLGHVDGEIANQDEINAACDYYLDAAEQEYQTDYPQSIRYMGLRRADPDGAIQQITIEIGEGGTTTTLSRNNEELLRTPTYRAKRAAERQREGPDLTKLVINMAAGQRQI